MSFEKKKNPVSEWKPHGGRNYGHHEGGCLESQNAIRRLTRHSWPLNGLIHRQVQNHRIPSELPATRNKCED